MWNVHLTKRLLGRSELILVMYIVLGRPQISQSFSVEIFKPREDECEPGQMVNGGLVVLFMKVREIPVGDTRVEDFVDWRRVKGVKVKYVVFAARVLAIELNRQRHLYIKLLPENIFNH